MKGIDPAKMSPEGRKRYDAYIHKFGREPEITNVCEAAYFGLITREEAVERISQTKRNFKIADRIIGVIGAVVFIAWLLLSAVVFSNFPSAEVFLLGHVVGVAGLVFSICCLKRSFRR